MVTVRGNLAPSEIWTNTWAFKETDPAAVPQDAVTTLHGFYANLAAEWMPTEFTAVGATIKDLSTGITSDAVWATITGADTQDILPTQLGVRVSLNDNANHRGGPFLCGFSKIAAAEDGVLDTGCQTDIATELANMAATLATEDYLIGIHRPTTDTVVTATQGRVGQRFDVIRKRSNANMEAYDLVALV